MPSKVAVKGEDLPCTYLAHHELESLSTKLTDIKSHEKGGSHARLVRMLCVQGTFFLLEKLKLTVLRRLLMRCCILHLEASAADPNPHHFPLGKPPSLLLPD